MNYQAKENIYASLVEGERIYQVMEKIRDKHYHDAETQDWCVEIEQRIDALFQNAYDNAKEVWQEYTDNTNGLV